MSSHRETPEAPDTARLASEVFAHKFFAPTAFPGTVRRDELLARLFRDPAYGVIVVQAPAGHGKSTLLQQAKAASEVGGALTGWMSFDESDNDMRRFTAHVSALIRSLGGDTPDRSPAQSIRRRLSDWVASTLVQLNRPIWLFFDEFQALRSPEVLGMFRDLLERIPENVTLMIGTREMPEIGLARLVVNNHALVLRADELRFSPEEAEAFFKQAKELSISRNELDTIYRQTEGWPAAMQLFRLSLASPAVRKSLGDLRVSRPRELAEYLADNVLTLQTPRIQEFLRRTSVLTRLSAALCDHVTGWQDSQSILLFLERSGLFLRCLDSDLCWFRYHTLFSSFLAEQLRVESEDDVTDVHSRAAEWFEHHGMFEDAVHHSIAANNHAQAADTMSHWADRLILDAELSTVERWSDALPLDEIEKRPELAVKICWALVFLRRMHKLKPILDALAAQTEEHLDTDVILTMRALMDDDIPQSFERAQKISFVDQKPEGFRAFELGAAANVSAFHAVCSGDYDTARSHLALARSFSLHGNAAFSGGYTVGVVGMNLTTQGKIDQALEQYRSGLAEQHIDLEKSFASASLVACYVQALYESNALEHAEAMFRQFHDVIVNGVLLDFLAQGYIAMIRTQDALGNPPRAEDLLAEADEIAYTANWPRLTRLIAWERVRRLLMTGDTSRAQVVASRIPKAPPPNLPEGTSLYSEIIEGESIGRLRLAIHSGQYDMATAQLSDELTLAQRKGRIYRLIRLLVLDAILQRRRNNDNQAHRSMRRALQLAAPAGVFRLFLDEGKDIIPLLRDAYASFGKDSADTSGSTLDESSELLRGFIARLLEAAGEQAIVATRSSDSVFQPLEALTDREREILVYLGNGVSNKEMARRLFVSENTIKFHLKNVYSKLGVSSRLQAINAARQMGILV
ncbi:MAG: LuxR C-terminal-related transcriptional regulator [Pseudomonadota bacterium]|nr:LuxR C-terminal-related transcriptional regulator [Pseudomonadota bacterium]